MGPAMSSAGEYGEVFHTNHICADCSEPILLGEDCVILEVRQPRASENGTVFCELIESAEDPQYQYCPYTFCFECWESNYESIRNDTEDTPPREDAYSQLRCICCGSGIRVGENVGTFWLGEFNVASRRPDNCVTVAFSESSPREPLCLYCLTLMNEGYIEMWENLSNFGECADCIHVCCWRDEVCGCTCHA